MSLKPEDLKQHCTEILNSPRIRKKIVVLCEGEIVPLQGRPSPQTYRKMENMPDSNFYRACIPTWWRQQRQYLPEFFNCGDRNDVLDTYFTLLELHNDLHSRDIESYLDPDKLFALVDVDIQPKRIDGYVFSNTEEVFHSLYQKIKVNEVNALNHRIWVTGLVHKEAYFFVPGLQTVFDEHSVQPIYKNRPLFLEDIYFAMANEITKDADLKNNFEVTRIRVNHCLSLDCSEITKLEKSWNTEFKKSNDNEIKNELIFSLLAIKKAKSYWHQIEPSGDWSRSTLDFRDQLLLKIGKFYSEQPDTAQYHIPSFFKTLHQFLNRTTTP